MGKESRSNRDLTKDVGDIAMRVWKLADSVAEIGDSLGPMRVVAASQSRRINSLEGCIDNLARLVDMLVDDRYSQSLLHDIATLSVPQFKAKYLG